MEEVCYDEDKRNEEELEIINLFNRIMLHSVHSTDYSFNKNDNKPYLIYKENDVWILDYCIKENRREKSEFTNLFNLCFLLLNHFNNPNLISFASSTLISIPRGTKVIVLKVGSVGLADNVDEYITIGTIISSEYNAALCAKEYIIYTDEGEQVKAIRKKIGESLYTFSPIKQFCTIENFLNETNQRFASNSVNYNKYNSYILKDAFEKVMTYKSEYFEQQKARKKTLK